jgi:hypothetical protein
MKVRRTAAAVAVSAAVALAAGLVTPTAVARTATQAAAPERAAASGLLKNYATDTWRSFTAMTDERTGLPADNVAGDLDAASRSEYTSPTNIGAYLWSTVAARDIGLITATEARERMSTTLATLGTLERHQDSGMFYNWYDPADGHKLTTWPENGSPVYPFLSSVDNGWLATALLLVSRAEPSLAHEADAIRKDMDFGFYYDEAENVGGQIRGGFWDEKPPGCSVEGNYRDRGSDVYYTCHHYGAFNTEPRMASYLGIAEGQIPQKHYFGTFRTFAPTCDWSWTETKPTGTWKEYLGVPVFEGALPYRGMNIVPTWGGSMFEALMVPLFVPEEKWGPDSWGINHPLYVKGQIEHGMDEAGYGYWGFSPAKDPAGGYREYGVDQLGLDGAGYTSDEERTSVDQPYEGCRDGSPAPTEYGDGVVTPHASFLALRYAPRAALTNLQRIRDDFGAYGPGGFYDSVAVRSGRVSKYYLALDQGMIMAALGNALAGDDMRGYVAPGPMEKRLRPLMEMEQFSASDSSTR